MAYDSTYWYSEWEKTKTEIARIRTDLDLKRAENDKDKIELDSERLNNLIRLSSYYWNKYIQTKNDEQTGVSSEGGLTYIGRSDYGW
jgi:hypothetical protein